MKKNPYALTFRKEPKQFISRVPQSQQVIDSFLEEPDTQQVYIITGIRGSGKTVLMTEISNTIAEQEDWICVELNPEKDLLTSLAAKLASKRDLARIFQTAKINLSFFGLGLEVQGEPPINDIEIAIQEMLLSLKKKNKHVLISIDEVTNTPQMKVFSAAFQIFLRQKLPVYLLMTGLYENINALQEEKSLTFLYRAPKIYLGPLNISSIARDYKSVLHLDDQHANDLAKLTKGYSFAFQVIGYFSWKYPDDPLKSQMDSQQYLEEYSYNKIWSELSHRDKTVLYGIASVESGKVKEIRDFLHFKPNEFAPYRQRLIKKGIISGDEYGHIRLLLPFFDTFILEHYNYD